MYCSFAYDKKIPQFLLIQLKYKLKGKNRFFGFTWFRIRRFFGFDFKQNRPSLGKANDLKGCPCKKLQDHRPQEISDNFNPN
jgi:hypothetical protein